MIETSPVEAPEQSVTRGGLTRRGFLALAAGSVGGLAVYAGEIERHEIDVVHQSIALAGLPDAFAGLRIVQLSDIHLEEFTEAAFLRAVVDRMNALHPDLIVFTGDFVSYLPAPVRFVIPWAYQCAGILSQLTCKLKYAILGNHDALVSPAAVTEALESHGIPVLSNSYVPLERAGQRIWLSGLADAMAQRPDLSLALPVKRDANREPLILLVHEPDVADSVVNLGIGLTLSGHTHGGQVRIPFVRPLHLPFLGRKYVEGRFVLPDGMQLYVNRGIGTVGVPFRFRCPPELTVITLTQAGSERH